MPFRKRFISHAIQVTAFSIVILSVGSSCKQTCEVLKDPDAAHFRNVVASKMLRDSLATARLLPGMPYFVIDEIYGNCNPPQRRQVPCIGSRQRIEDIEGWGRRYSCPKPMIYLDVYKTTMGELAVWYDFPDFYLMNVSAGDTLFLIRKDDPGRVFFSPVEFLANAGSVELKEKVPPAFRSDTLFGEIHYRENRDRPSGVSYWYMLELSSDERTVTLKQIGFPL